MNVVFNFYLILASIPYLTFTAYDMWMHKHDRQVPRVEQVFHAIILPCVVAFLLSAITGYTTFAVLALILALPCMAVDELKYHQRLHVKERRVHYLAGA